MPCNGKSDRLLGVKHRYTRPYRPQTNGKVERFWRTLNEDLIEGTTFETLEEFKDELEQYLLCYNEFRPHQALNAKTPKRMNEEYQQKEAGECPDSVSEFVSFYRGARRSREIPYGHGQES